MPGHGLGPRAPAPAAMTSLPCSLPGPDASKAVFPDIAPVPSVVAAYQLGLSPATAAAPDLPYSGPYGHLLPYPYTGPAIPGDSYLPCQLSTAPSQPAHQERETGKSRRGGSAHLWGPAPVSPQTSPSPGWAQLAGFRPHSDSKGSGGGGRAKGWGGRQGGGAGAS